MFLGVAIVAATIYLVYIQKPQDIPVADPLPLLPEERRARRNNFIRWATAATLPRRYFLHMAVFCLAFGVALLPAAYVDVPNMTVLYFGLGCAVAAVVGPALVDWMNGDFAKAKQAGRRKRRRDESKR
ncbi:MAG: hypothetical protein NVSMB6_32600 [Burkholderiaceae bacterium]